MNMRGDVVGALILLLVSVVLLAAFLSPIDDLLGTAFTTLDCSTSLSSVATTKTLLGLLGLFMAVGLILGFYNRLTNKQYEGL